ncbi:hypothetical protein LJB77_03350 [Ruminococcaceae bacterium OttesenSCG-928-N02]|nr:hypothetical protein [Ruminococcaceae bacterium OttesenSCG-928-N02]
MAFPLKFTFFDRIIDVDKGKVVSVVWEGRDIDELRSSVYGKFYTGAEIDIIQEASLPEKMEIKRLINKAEKIGDIETVFALKKSYADILKPPKRVGFYPSLSRAELEAKEAALLDAAHKRLVERPKRRKKTAGE